MQMRSRWSLFVSLTLVAACATGTPTRPSTPRASAAAGPSAGVPGAATGTPGPQATAQAPLAAALSGLVLAPGKLISDHGAGLVSNNGGNIVSNNGGGVISNNGGGLIGKTKYRLAALDDERGLVGVTVRLLDASGQPVKGADGQPLTAVTDATGRYAFKDVPALHNMVLASDLGEAGRLTAIAPRAGARTVDLDLVSTLTTTYILDQYVAGQADPVVTLDRLPGDVEADTRGKAQSAYAAGKTAAPDTLTTANVVAAVASLRKDDPGFDAQLETVKKLLILAGQSNLGAGQAATAVDLAAVNRLLAAPDGTLYLVTANRIWRMPADGKLYVAYGGGSDGQQLTPVTDAALDARGRLLVMLQDAAGTGFHVVRHEADGSDTGFGSVPAIASGHVEVLGLFAGKSDEALVVASGYGPTSLPLAGLSASEGDRIFSLAPGRAATVSRTLPSGSGSATSIGGPVGLAADGTLVARGGDDMLAVGLPPGATAFQDLVNGVLSGAGLFGGTPLPSPRLQAGAVAIAPTGEVVALGPAGVSLLPLSGAPTPIAPLPEGVPFDESNLVRACVAPDGSVYLAGSNTLASFTAPWLVYRLAAGQATLAAGHRSTASPAPAGAVSLHAPAGLAVAGGHIRVLDDHAALDVGADGTVTTTASFQTGFGTLLNGLAADAAGNLYALETSSFVAPKLDHLDPAGHQDVVYQGPPGSGGLPSTERVLDFTCLADGTLAILLDRGFGTDSVVPVLLHGKAGATLDALALDNAALGLTASTPAKLAAKPDGGLVIATPGAVHGVDGAGKLTSVATQGLSDAGSSLALDPQGRLYMSLVSGGQGAVARYAAGATTPVAGPGTRYFAGTGVDDGLSGAPGLAFAPDGALLLLDAGHKQLKRVPANAL